MSDIAPFVAAVLWDRPLKVLLEENKKLRAEIQSYYSNKTPMVQGVAAAAAAAAADDDESGVEPKKKRAKTRRIGTLASSRDDTAVNLSNNLAPFVANVLRDRAVTELETENKRLQEEINKLLSRFIKVTGPGGSPVYARRHIIDATVTDPEIMEAELDLFNSTGYYKDTSLPTCPVQDIEHCELHIGDKQVIIIGSYDATGVMSSVGDETASLHYMYNPTVPGDINSWHETSIVVEWGPTNPNEEQVHAPETYHNQAIEFVRFKDVEFHRHPFPETSSIVEGVN